MSNNTNNSSHDSGVEFKITAAQGDVYIKKINGLPSGLVKAKADRGRFVVAHSETGHHHVVEAPPEGEYWIDPNNMLKAYLVIQGIIGTAMEHLRSFDTHAKIKLPPGIYELRRSRERRLEGWAQTRD